MAKGLEYVSWVTPSGTIVRQEYREPITKRVTTHAMGGGNYRKLTEHKGEKGRIQLTVQVGWGDVKQNKASTALGANFTHSLDADVLQGAVNNLQGDFYIVHDCEYSLATDTDQHVQHIRNSFHRVVSIDTLQNLIDTNELDLEPPTKGEGSLVGCTESQFMFS